MNWLVFLGKRRPKSLEDHGSYAESVSRPTAEPVRHSLPSYQVGYYLGGRPNGIPHSTSCL
jgi:hypothetical protein